MEESFSLRELREQQEWTQERLAEIAGVELQTIQDIEAGTAVSWQVAARIVVKVKNYVGDCAVKGLNIPQHPQNRG
jgi:DNA-binding XRE family transcriptional regulator